MEEPVLEIREHRRPVVVTYVGLAVISAAVISVLIMMLSPPVSYIVIGIYLLFLTIGILMMEMLKFSLVLYQDRIVIRRAGSVREYSLSEIGRVSISPRRIVISMPRVVAPPEISRGLPRPLVAATWQVSLVSRDGRVLDTFVLYRDEKDQLIRALRKLESLGRSVPLLEVWP